MKSKTTAWADALIALLLMLNSLLIVHLLHYGIIMEQSAQILAVLLFYAWLSQWAKKAI